jgi:Raf kinase inhibitor-like YbhB/YbcL family protein
MKITIKRLTFLVSFLAFAFTLAIFFVFTRSTLHPAPFSQSQTTQSSMNQLFHFFSPVFSDGGTIPSDYTCKGEGGSPPLAIEHAPPHAASLALIVRDPDAPSGDFIHWIAWNIKPGVTEIESKKILDGATEGISSAGLKGWTPPCPPSGTHRYVFTVYALDSVLELPETGTVAELENALKGHVIDQAQIIGRVSH